MEPVDEQVAVAGHRGAPSRWAVAALIVAVVMGAVILFAPLGQRTTTENGVTTSGAVSLWQTQPITALTIALILIALAAIPVLAGSSRFRRPVMVVVAILLGTLTLLGILSIGVYVLPVFVLALIAAIRG